jgi:hypothetical protein
MADPVTVSASVDAPGVLLSGDEPNGGADSSALLSMTHVDLN